MLKFNHRCCSSGGTTLLLETIFLVYRTHLLGQTGGSVNPKDRPVCFPDLGIAIVYHEPRFSDFLTDVGIKVKSSWLHCKYFMDYVIFLTPKGGFILILLMLLHIKWSFLMQSFLCRPLHWQLKIWTLEHFKLGIFRLETLNSYINKLEAYLIPLLFSHFICINIRNNLPCRRAMHANSSGLLITPVKNVELFLFHLCVHL